jgi:hypothetical protein
MNLSSTVVLGSVAVVGLAAYNWAKDPVAVPVKPVEAVTVQPELPTSNAAQNEGIGVSVVGNNNTTTVNVGQPSRVIERPIERVIERTIIVEKPVERVIEKPVVIERTITTGPTLTVVKPTESCQHTVLTDDPYWAQKHAEYVDRSNQWKAMFGR